ncbi:MAG: hypothetical protein JO294_06815, partial [Alphaproteobacteria bacterium]|nr:hypothetical protein [Alphaproteobacteria bacterium]
FANADSTGGGPVPLTPIAEGQCQTYAPSGWTVVETNPNGTFFRTASADQSMQAAYVGMGMHGDLNIPGLANFQTTPPNVMLQQVIGAISNAAVNVTADGETFGGYTVMRFTSGNYSGYALYYRASQMPDFTLPDGGQSAYILIARIAFGANGDNRSVATAGSVAAAIRCTAIVIPHPIGGDTDRSSSHGAGTSAKCSGGGSCDDSDLAGTYNAQLGTGWVHDSLGRNYNVDVTADYNDNGPDGPGYYASVGGTQEKLQPGLQ